MKKHILVYSLTFLFFGFFSVSLQTMAQSSKNGYIDMSYIHQNLPDVKQAEARIKAVEEAHRQELEAKNKQLKAEREKIQKEKKEISAEVNTRLAGELQEFENLSFAKAQEVANRREASYKIINEKIKKAIQQTALEKGYTAIQDISSLIYFDPKDDITKLVLEKLGVTGN
jgi:Skp family chaperone for outer membrane proteins